LCDYSGICSPVSAEVCDLLGGTPVWSCPESSSSSVAQSSSSALPSSDSEGISSSSSEGNQSSSSLEGANYAIECKGSLGSTDCRKTINLKIDECVEIAVLGYTEQFFLPDLIMRCEGPTM